MLLKINLHRVSSREKEPRGKADISSSPPRRYHCAAYRKCGEERGKKEKFKPLSNRALVKLVEREEQRASGIILPDAAKEKPWKAHIFAVGAHEDVTRSAPRTSRSFAKYAGTEFKIY